MFPPVKKMMVIPITESNPAAVPCPNIFIICSVVELVEAVESSVSTVEGLGT